MLNFPYLLYVVILLLLLVLRKHSENILISEQASDSQAAGWLVAPFPERRTRGEGASLEEGVGHLLYENIR